MSRIERIIRAFFTALKLTIQGKTIQPPEEQYPNLSRWIDAGTQLTKAAFTAAERHGMDKPAREQLILHLNRRDISMQTILAAVRYHMETEYPLLLKSRMAHNLTTLYATNLDDQYRVAQLAQSEQLAPEVRKAVQILSEHLHNIPSSLKP